MKGLKVIKVIAWLIMLYCGFTGTDRYTLTIVVICGLALVSYIDLKQIGRWRR